MNKVLFFIVFAFVVITNGCGKTIMKPTGIPSKEHYSIYDHEGSSTNLQRILEMSEKTDVILIGENHNDYVAHVLEKRILELVHCKYQNKSGGKKKREVILSMEMFETDTQVVLDEYLSGMISKSHFLAGSRAWPNFVKDYLPLIDYAKKNSIPVIAGNAPRRYVNLVSRKGREALNLLSETAQAWIAPLPYKQASAAYKKKIDKLNREFQNEHKENKKTKRKKIPHTIKEKIVKGVDHNAQSLWDATMAWSISKALNKHPGGLVININGRFHSENNLGIPEHLNGYDSSRKLIIITILPDKNYREFKKEYINLGDFIILSDPKFSRPGSMR